MMRLLAVDDDDSILELLSEILTSFGYTDIVTALSGQDALQAISDAEEPFDCLLLDIQMPQMNGITLCQKVRMVPEYQFVPIIMLTAMVQKRYIDDAFEAGATDYVTKPFDFLDLQKRLEDAQRLAAERQASIAAILEMETLSDGEMPPQSFRLSDPLQVEGVTGCIGYAEFQNYVLQMSRARLLDSTLLAIKVTNIEEIFGSNSYEIFSRLITAAARRISRSLHGKGNLVSYRGNGLFLMIRHNQDAVDSLTYEDELNSEFSTGPTPEIFAIDPVFIVGEEVHLNSNSESIVGSTLDMAIESVENKHAFAPELLAFPRKNPETEKPTPVDHTPRQRSYRVRLRDMLLSDRRKKNAANDNPDGQLATGATSGQKKH